MQAKNNYKTLYPNFLETRWTITTKNMVMIMLKIIAPIIFFIFVIYAISYYWDKANAVNKRKIVVLVSVILVATLSLSIYLIID